MRSQSLERTQRKTSRLRPYICAPLNFLDVGFVAYSHLDSANNRGRPSGTEEADAAILMARYVPAPSETRPHSRGAELLRPVHLSHEAESVARATLLPAMGTQNGRGISRV
jgi:hypothetical protein